MLLVKYGELEREQVIAHFFEKVYKVVMIENHILKFKGWDHVEFILNKICKQENFDITFKWHNDQWEITGNDTVLVYTLPELFFIFRTTYRFQEV